MTGSSRYENGKALPRPPETIPGVLSDALYIASRNGRTDVAKWLLDHGASPKFKAFAGGSPLHWAYFSGEPAVVDLLLAHEAEAEALDDEIQAPPRVFGIMMASGFGIVRLTRQILDTGLGDVDCASPHGTPLHWASRWGNAAVVELLLERGADARALNAEGKTALDAAKENGHAMVVEILEKHVSDS